MAEIRKEVEKMNNTDFKLKATSKDLGNRLQSIKLSAEKRRQVLLSILEQWEEMREKLKHLVEWMDEKDLELKKLKDQVDVGNEDEVRKELSQLKVFR